MQKLTESDMTNPNTIETFFIPKFNALLESKRNGSLFRQDIDLTSPYSIMKFLNDSINVDAIRKNEQETTDLIVFIKSLMEMEKQNGKLSDKYSQDELPFIYKVMMSRINAFHDFTISDAGAMLILDNCPNLGVVNMWCWWLQYLAKKHNKKHLDLNFLIIHALTDNDISLDEWRELSLQMRFVSNEKEYCLFNSPSAGRSLMLEDSVAVS